MDDKDEDTDTFDPNLPEEGPSAPPPGWLDSVTGYEEHTGGDCTDQICPPPPDFVPKPENDKNASVPNVMVPTVSEDVARDALLQFVGKKWTYSSKPAKNLIFKELIPFTVYRYRLETFTESRSSAWESEPHTGQCVDGPQNGVSPPPWNVQVSYPPKFTNAVQKVRVPHSSFIKPCHRCHGNGKVRCTHCRGQGLTRCMFCHGSGHSRNRRCTTCHGRGRKRKNQVFEFIPNRVPEFPLKKFEKVSGEAFFVDENLLVYPIEGFPDQDICDASKGSIQNHLLKYSAVSRILQQRQTIELVPLTHVYYAYSGNDYDYFVFGRENKVHTTKYPSSCSIL
ncbi:protein SSUH2 homolog isoform X2 [Carassius gibelio]|uniref:protein SSUH2 homolog isoform X2 n=1 Tax=Carassius gibelio TaxID=101364 RepID=UPI002277BD96|nr:protein SSUH2 homolog isoform X2 [Carassius gibelio]